MEKYKDIIDWLKTNQNKDSYSEVEYFKGIEILGLHTKNTFLCERLKRSLPNKMNKGLLHYNLNSFMKTALISEQRKVQPPKNIVIRTSGPQVVVSEPIQTVEVRPTVPVAKNMNELLMPASIISLRSRSGELFRKAGRIHRQLVERFFGRKDVSEIEKNEIKGAATEIVALMDENVSILDKVDAYVKTGALPVIDELKIDVPLSSLSIKQLNSKKKSTQASMYRYQRKLKSENNIKKQKVLSNKINACNKEIERISKELNLKQNAVHS